MPEKLTPETEERIQGMCRQISVAHNLDEEIQAELYSHMEDKLLGYLSGEEKVSEEDALILVREHFGKPELIGNMLRKTHQTAATLNFFQNIAILAVFTLFSLEITGFLSWPIYVLENWVFKGIATEYVAGISTLIRILLIVLPLILLWKGLAHFGKALRTGDRIRKIVGNSFFLSGLLITVYALYMLLAYLPWIIQPPIVTVPDATPVFIRHMMYFAMNVIVCLIWMFWLRIPCGEIRAAATGFVAWMVYRVLIGYTHTLLRQWLIEQNIRYAFFQNLFDYAKIGFIAILMYTAILWGIHLLKKSPAVVIIRR